MKAAGYDEGRIAEELDVSLRTVQRHVADVRERAEKVGPHMAVLEVITKAGPAYGLFRLTPLRKVPGEILDALREEGR